MPDVPDVPAEPVKPFVPEVPDVPDVPVPPPPVIVTVAWPLPLFTKVAPLNTILVTLLIIVGSASSNPKLAPNEPVDTCLVLLPLSPTQTYPCLKEAVKGPLISIEPVICKLFVVALIEPVTVNIPSVVAVPLPNDDVATNLETLPMPPTKVYPSAIDAVNEPLILTEPLIL